MDAESRVPLNELAYQLAGDAGQRLTKIPGIHAVCVTFVGADDLPLGTLVYDKNHQDASTLVKAIGQLSKHISVLASALGTEKDEGNHSESVGGQGQKQTEPDRGAPTSDTTPDTTDEAAT